MSDIIIVEDTASIAAIYEACLEKAGHNVAVAATAAAGLALIYAREPDAILLDLRLPDAEGLDILRQIRAHGISSAVVVITGRASLNTAVEAMRAGADDFVAKPVDPDRLQITVANALEKRRLRKLVHSYEDLTRDSFEGFIGASPDMRAAYRMIEAAARSRAPVMVTGESGTGKEVAAQAIHHLSERKNAAMVPLNCAAIPHDLLESEIFGHVRGAFTGALSDRDGAAKLADQGTLFLDELSEMPLALQSKLLRFVQTGMFTPVGASVPVQADIRFICATNRNPLEAIAQGKLREDLYYRLAVIPISLPPLRERGSDTVLIARHFLERAARQERKSFRSLDASAEEALLSHNWPGNVRELENVIRHAVIMHDAEILTASMVDFRRFQQPSLPVAAPAGGAAGVFARPQDIRPLKDLERGIIEGAIAVCGGNITEAARRLGLNPSTIHRKQKSWS